MITTQTRFTATNESIDSAMIGLKPQEGDLIAAVLGSGDIAFALTAAGARVFGSDICADQIEYVKQRVKQIIHNRQGEFLAPIDLFTGVNYPDDIERRWEYFTRDGIWQQLRANIQNLEIINNTPLSNLVQERDVNKVYASNAIAWGWLGDIEYGMMKAFSENGEYFRLFRNTLAQGSRLYRVKHEMQRFLPKEYEGFALLEGLTNSALEAQYDECFWIPEVYERT